MMAEIPMLPADTTKSPDAKELPSGGPAITMRRATELAARIGLSGVAVVYVIGFLCLNAHLSKYGYTEFRFGHSRYLIAGGITIVYMVVWYLFAGRAVINVTGNLGKEIAFMKACGLGRVWHFIAFIGSYIHVLFMICLASAFFSFIAFSTKSDVVYISIMTFAFLISYTIDVANVDVRYPRTASVATILCYMLGIYGFWLAAGIDQSMFLVISSYFGMSVVANFMLDAFERRKATPDLVSYTAIYLILFAGVMEVSFGYLHYGIVRQKVGGGLPIDVVISFEDGFKNPDGETYGGSYHAKLVHTSDDEVLIVAEARSVLIKKSGIQRISIEPEESVGELEKMDIWR